MIIPNLLRIWQQNFSKIPEKWEKSGLFQIYFRPISGLFQTHFRSISDQYGSNLNLAIFARVFPAFARLSPVLLPCSFVTLSTMNTFTEFLTGHFPDPLQVDCRSVTDGFT